MKFHLIALVLACATASAQQLPVSVAIGATGPRSYISPLVYGVNAYVYDSEWGSPDDWKTGLDNQPTDLNVTARRLGGNTMTSYNWETGYSNSGNDDQCSNNTFQSFITGAGSDPYAPGAAITLFHQHSQQLHASSLLQLPAAGYVAADGNGPVTPSQTAPSQRWDAVVFDKPGTPATLSLTPDLNDGLVYVDEEVYHLQQTFGTASSTSGVGAYELDNEPGLWHHYLLGGDEGTHSRLHAEVTTCQDVLSRNIALAQTVRRMDASAAIYGPAMWGYPEYYSLWSVYDGSTHAPSDWSLFNREPFLTNGTGDGYRYNHMTWVNAYLAGMHAASDQQGTRLLDVFSVHYYPDDAAVATPALRVQATRSLWDPTFVEPSWITADGNGFTDGRSLELIPKLKLSIADFYPGTRLALTEYSFGGRHDVSGGIAEADALGIFGREGVYAAYYFFPADDYIGAGIRIFRNYDGANSTFGDTAVACRVSNDGLASAFASVDDVGRLHLIAINRNLDHSLQLTITASDRWREGSVYGFGPESSAITVRGPIVLTSGVAAYSLPAATVVHMVFMPATTGGVSGAVVRPGTIRIRPNPAPGAFDLEYFAERPGTATISLVDKLGRRVSMKADRADLAGWRTVHFDATSLPSGWYGVVLRGGTTASTVVNIVR